MVKGVSWPLYEYRLRQVDTSLSFIISALKQFGWYDQTLTVITGDHGEALGEHNYVGHGGDLHEPVIRIPLIIKPPVYFQTLVGRQINHPVSNIDIAPTVVDILGIKVPTVWQGKSLLPLFQGGTMQEKPCFAISHPSYMKAIAIISGAWKLIHYQDNSRTDELFNLNTDPREEENLFLSSQNVAKKLLMYLPNLSYFESVGLRNEDEIIQKRLAALGYIE